MKIFTFLALLLASFSIYAQDQQQGYYITTNGQRIDGYFKTTDFYNAASLQFKQQSSEESFSNLDANTISEYGIGTEFKFIKKTFKIDDSETNLKRLSTNPEPKWITITGFLNVIIEGKASLYSYRSDKGEKFFFSTPDKELEQLVYKHYRVSESSFSRNDLYLQQLLNNVRCESMERSMFATLSYDKKSLMRIFKRYNDCNGDSYNVYDNNSNEENTINFTVFAAANYSSFGIKGSGADSEIENFISPSIGFEAAIVLPTESLELFGRAEFESLSAKTKATYNLGVGNYTVENYDLDAQTINLRFGLRYNFIQKSNNKFFIDGAFGITKPFGDIKEEIIVSTTSGSAFVTEYKTHELKSAFCGNFGVGYMYKNKFGAAIRYETSRNMFSNGGKLTTDISRIGLNLRYTLN